MHFREFVPGNNVVKKSGVYSLARCFVPRPDFTPDSNIYMNEYIITYTFKNFNSIE
jgi:hypothetical protein